MHSTTYCKEISYLIHTPTCPHTKPRYTTHTRLALAISKKRNSLAYRHRMLHASISSLAEPVPVPWKPQTTPAFIVLILQLNRRRRSRDTSPPPRETKRGRRPRSGGSSRLSFAHALCGKTTLLRGGSLLRGRSLF